MPAAPSPETSPWHPFLLSILPLFQFLSCPQPPESLGRWTTSLLPQKTQRLCICLAHWEQPQLKNQEGKWWVILSNPFAASFRNQQSSFCLNSLPLDFIAHINHRLFGLLDILSVHISPNNHDPGVVSTPEPVIFRIWRRWPG